MNTSLITKLIAGAIIAFALLVFGSMAVEFYTVKGNEIGVVETWSGGVKPEPLTPKTYVWIPGLFYKGYSYEINQQVFVMNNKLEDKDEEFAEGRKNDSYLVQSKEGQDMHVSLNVQWRRDPSKVVDLHKSVRDKVEERLIRPEVMRIVKDAATTRTALEAYSGDGLVELQREIEAKLKNPESELRSRGIIVDQFLIEHIGLDPKYVEEIKARQVAVQERLKNIEQTKAAEAAAEKAKAIAQADFEREVVMAKRDKETGILEAEKKAQQQILAAEAQAKQTVVAAEAAAKQVELAAGAEKERNVLIATGEKEAGLLRADAILALGTAEAEATKLKLQAYAVSGADAYVKIQVAQNMAEAFKNIKGYLPESMNVNLLTENFNKGVSILMDGATPAK